MPTSKRTIAMKSIDQLDVLIELYEIILGPVNKQSVVEFEEQLIELTSCH